MDLLRPEVKVWLYKWKEPLISTLVTLLGLRLAHYGLSNHNLVLLIVGSVIVIIGICVVVVSYIRISFSKFPNGVGIIEVKEKQIIYFDPSGGSVFSSDSLISIELKFSDKLGLIWRLKTEDGSFVEIPLNASGNEKLFDVFMTLPKIDQAHLISSVKNPENLSKIIWSK